MKCRHYDRIVPGCAYCDSIIESERQERAERDRAVIVETLEGRLACETALVDTLRTDVSRLTSALDVALESARSAEHRVDALRAENARLREALEAILNGIAVVNGMRVLRPDSPTSAEIRAALTR